MSTNIPGIFAAGNVVTIYDLVDYVSAAGSAAGISAAHFAAGAPDAADNVNIIPGEGVRSVIPQKISRVYGSANPVFVELRVSREFSEKVSINIMDNGSAVYSHAEKYARPAEMITLKINWNELSKKLSKDCKDLAVKVVENNAKAEG